MQQPTPPPKKEDVKPPKPKEANKPAEKKSNLNFVPQIKKAIQTAQHYQVPIIIIAVSGLLAITALRMLHYANPEIDDLRVQENTTKVKQVRINQKVVERIRQLGKDDKPAKADKETGRTNPFAEKGD
jgi:hypothetical protein